MMIKYQQRWYSKAFAMFLALTILIAAPFSTVQAYAMEGAQLTESVNPGDTSRYNFGDGRWCSKEAP